ncbi:DUF262 domain-containing protein [Sphingomonas aliaeris]|uniref:DUF262 domain-containing protein n=1 Tax=Sphingomonas aliaeris TaxID=2759526 RepID=A0A974NY52_9SPHN|nr:DUF262 domain-containing protein [Sphingomonas aliaeris]QQV78953.1 DUF262 domain-containing protein [Sphingomonas aliaeris]
MDTILNGYPFPQIFLARGPIDLDSMTASQAVVDGQQRLNTILDFVGNKIDLNGSFFSDLSPKKREEFLKYEVPVIDFDLDVGDPRLKEVFHRLNRTYYSLSSIEKLASEYSASDFMLLARLLSGEILRREPDDEYFDIADEDTVGVEVSESSKSAALNVFSRDPGIDDSNWRWLTERAEGPFSNLIRQSEVFTSFEFDRKVPLMFTLNVMCTFLLGYYERNDRVRKMLDERSTSFPERDEVLSTLDETAQFIFSMMLPPASPWWNKANFFTVISELARQPSLRQKDPVQSGYALMDFATNFPDDYILAAREAVSRKPQRELRGRMVRSILDGVSEQVETAPKPNCILD